MRRCKQGCKYNCLSSCSFVVLSYMSVSWRHDVDNSLISFFMVAAGCRDMPCFSPICSCSWNLYGSTISSSMSVDLSSFCLLYLFWIIFFLCLIRRVMPYFLDKWYCSFNMLYKQSAGYPTSWSFISRSSSTRVLGVCTQNMGFLQSWLVWNMLHNNGFFYTIF